MMFFLFAERSFSVLLLLILSYGLGYSLTRFLKTSSFNTVILRLGIGLGTIPVLGVFLNTLHIPLDWRIFLILSVLLPLYDLKKKGFKVSCSSFFKSKPVEIAVILLFVINVWIYCHGAFVYPWLEDDDPWTHAVGIKYIALEKNLNVRPGEFHYMNPYPPGYDLTLGILHQTNSSLYWTMKFINAFIVSLSFLFFYLMVLEFTQDKILSLTALFVLTCLPCYLSHFIWAHSLVVALFFPALTGIKKSLDNKKFILPSVIVTAGIFLTQPTQSIKFVIMLFLFMLAFYIVYKKIPRRCLLILALAAGISLLWFGPVAKDMIQGSSYLAARKNQASNASRATQSVIGYLFSPKSGTATQAYSMTDYLYIRRDNYINNPLGIGMVVFILGILGLTIYTYHVFSPGPKEETARLYSITVLLWLLFTVLGMNSLTFHLPVGMFAFRFWMLFAIPLSIITAEAVLWLTYKLRHRHQRVLLSMILLFSVAANAGYYKFLVNTIWWTYGVYWTSDDEMKAYLWMRGHLPPDTKVFVPTNNFFVLGHDMLAETWRDDYKNAFENALDLSLDELYKRLRQQDYEYLVIGQQEMITLGLEGIKDILQELKRHEHFELVYREGIGARIFRLVP